MTSGVAGRLGLAASLFAFVLTGCLNPAGTKLSTVLPDPNTNYPLPVSVFDQAGIVTGIEPGTGADASITPRVAADPDDPQVLVVWWLGGACTDEVVITVIAGIDGYGLRLEGRKPFVVSCSAIGIFRAVRIRTSEQVEVDRITVSGGED